jgi:hypothetical protein
MLVCSPQGSRSHTAGSTSTFTPVLSAMAPTALGSTVLSFSTTGWSSASLISAELSGAAAQRPAARSITAEEKTRARAIGCRIGKSVLENDAGRTYGNRMPSCVGASCAAYRRGQ